MKVAIIHYWLVSMRGGEKVLESLLELYPEADIYTHVLDRDNLSEKIKSKNIQTTFINRLPFARRLYKYYLAFMPLALEQIDLTNYDLVISSEAGPSKGVIVNPDSTHLCYCHSPMRYIWDQYSQYFSDKPLIFRICLGPLMHYLRLYDSLSSARVDHFIANSKFVAQRIAKYYRRESEVISPPVSVKKFKISENISDYYLVVSQLVPYKNIDLAIKAFKKNGKELIVVGRGEKQQALKWLAEGAKNIKFLDRVSEEKLVDLYSKAKAFLFPGVEDFGITAVEALASGRPVIAFNKGGLRDIVIDGVSGVFFPEATVESFNSAITNFESKIEEFDPNLIKKQADKFSEEIFLKKISTSIKELRCKKK